MERFLVDPMEEEVARGVEIGEEVRVALKTQFLHSSYPKKMKKKNCLRMVI